jgi:hypothetical protein
MSQKTLMEGSYIIAFYTNIGTLNNYYAQYQNLMLEIKHTYSNDIDVLKKAESMSPDQRDAIKQATQSLRIITTQVYMQYESLKKQIKIEEKQDEEIQKLYIEIAEKYIPDAESMKKYVLSFNKVLANDILIGLFDTSQEIINIKNG